MNIAKIALPKLNTEPFDYLIPEGLNVEIGDYVVINFRGKELTGIVWQIFAKANSEFKLKAIEKKLPFSPFHQNLIEFINKSAQYNLQYLGSILKLALPIDLNFKRKIAEYQDQFDKNKLKLHQLNDEQEQAYQQIKNSADNIFLLKGITGSGKTEVFFKLIADSLNNNNEQVLLLLPEIILTSQIFQRAVKSFGFEPAIWHSEVSKKNKKIILNGIINGEVKFVIGARSALFLPYKNLKLIIVDEEHDQSYKQEDGTIYHARNMAVLRASIEKSKVILSSATPSLESLYNYLNKKYQLIKLMKRHNKVQLPEIDIVDMSQEKLKKEEYISKKLAINIENYLAKKQQILLFLNRKGYAPLVICNACGFRHMCPNCSAWLVWHKKNNRLVCHHCDYNKYSKNNCPSCKTDSSFVACGPGIERLAEEAKTKFPKARILTISRDEIQNSQQAKEIITLIENNEVDIIIGTQVITKGLHFAKLNLIGIIDADLGLNGGDLRAAEKTFQVLQQVAGRAGRESSSGKAIIQTYHPDNSLVVTLKENDQNAFEQYELASRDDAEMPPFTKLASLTLAGKNLEKVKYYSYKIVDIAPIFENLEILGPTNALMARVNNQYRYKILFKAKHNFNLQSFLKSLLNKIELPSSINIKIDIDPMSFL